MPTGCSPLGRRSPLPQEQGRGAFLREARCKQQLTASAARQAQAPLATFSPRQAKASVRRVASDGSLRPPLAAFGGEGPEKELFCAVAEIREGRRTFSPESLWEVRKM